MRKVGLRRSGRQIPSGSGRLASIFVLLTLFVVLVFPVTGGSPPRVGVEVTRQVYLMGTLCTLITHSAERQGALQQLETFVRILDDTEEQLSTWRPSSLVSRLNQRPVGIPFSVGRSFCRLFGDLLFWQRVTDAAFDPAIGPLVNAWGLREGGRRPSPEVLQSARKRSGAQHFEYDASQCRITRTSEVTIDVGAFGKGEALDRVRGCAAANDSTAWLVDLGGQVIAYGLPQAKLWQVEVAHPILRDQPLLRVKLSGGSLATSGGSERDLQASDGRLGHILDPRSGLPAKFQGSVTVWNASALVADILSTALYVMGPEKGIPWAESRDLAVCFLLVREGKVNLLFSKAWKLYFAEG